MPNYDYDKDLIKNSLSLDQIEELLTEWDAEPERRGEIIVAKTICHNNCGCGTHKLYYYPNSTLFHCYTDCADSFDIFSLAQKVLSRENPKIREDSNWLLPEAIDYVARKFGFAPNEKENDNQISIKQDLQIIEKYDRIKDINIETQEIELKEYEGNVLKHLPHNIIITPWIEEGITQEVMNNAGICYDPKNCGIVIPHYDINNRLIGIRERTLIKEQAEQYGKYMPAKLGKTRYTHPLGFNLYNLNHSKDNISRMEKAFVFEGEKSCLLYRSYFGEENDLSVSVCGSSFINYQAWLLIQQGVKEIIICLDKQYQELNDNEHKKLVKNLKNIHNKYGKFINISFIFDKGKLLDYKSSPIDHGPEVFLQLFKERVNLYQ